MRNANFHFPVLSLLHGGFSLGLSREVLFDDARIAGDQHASVLSQEHAMPNISSELHVHIVWHTKQSLPLLSQDIEKLAHASLRARCVEEQGVFVHEIGGTETHVHLCITYPPTLTLSTFIGQLKGRSSHAVNNRSGRREAELQWQTGYGVVSFGTGDLDWVKKYIKNQREHHQRESAQDRLERITRFDA